MNERRDRIRRGCDLHINYSFWRNRWWRASVRVKCVCVCVGVNGWARETQIRPTGQARHRRIKWAPTSNGAEGKWKIEFVIRSGTCVTQFMCATAKAVDFASPDLLIRLRLYLASGGMRKIENKTESTEPCATHYTKLKVLLARARRPLSVSNDRNR